MNRKRARQGLKGEREMRTDCGGREGSATQTSIAAGELNESSRRFCKPSRI